jgi:transcriptional regulator with XRE-family HTH domain
MSTLSDTVRNNVRAERGRRRWSQAELADRIGLNTANVSNLETGRRALLADHLPLLCRAFGISLTQLTFGATEEDLKVLGLE